MRPGKETQPEPASVQETESERFVFKSTEIMMLIRYLSMDRDLV